MAYKVKKKKKKREKVEYAGIGRVTIPIVVESSKGIKKQIKDGI